MKRIEIDGVFYRWRRGVLVAIPEAWVNKVTTHRTKRNRPSKLVGKVKRASRHGRKNIDYIDSKTQPIPDSDD